MCFLSICISLGRDFSHFIIRVLVVIVEMLYVFRTPFLNQYVNAHTFSHPTGFLTVLFDAQTFSSFHGVHPAFLVLVLCVLGIISQILCYNVFASCVFQVLSSLALLDLCCLWYTESRVSPVFGEHWLGFLSTAGKG